MQRAVFEDVRIEGHLIDSGIMSAVMDSIISMGGEFESLSFEVGRTNDDPSVAVLRVSADTQAQLDAILAEIQYHGAVACDASDAEFVAGRAWTGSSPTASTPPPTWRPRCASRAAGCASATPRWTWACASTRSSGSADTVPMAAVREGDLFVVGHKGIRVHPHERPRDRQAFEFMSSSVSSEKPKAQVVADVARMLRDTRAAGRDVIAVVGPAVVHTGAAQHLARLVELGYVSVLFGGNAVATHDIESALYGTSLGVGLEDGVPWFGGHEHHLRAINTIRSCGSIAEAVEQGVLTKGLMYTLVKRGVPFVLAGSIRDDGPLPDVITDCVDAQNEMRAYAQNAGACLMLSTMLHSIATGNMLPASTTTVCVDINPAVVTKLADRGSWQTVGIVTDVGLFLEHLANELER